MKLQQICTADINSCEQTM